MTPAEMLIDLEHARVLLEKVKAELRRQMRLSTEYEVNGALDHLTAAIDRIQRRDG